MVSRVHSPTFQGRKVKQFAKAFSVAFLIFETNVIVLKVELNSSTKVLQKSLIKRSEIS